MWRSSLQLDKYQYAKTNPYLIKGIGILGIIATLLMGYGLMRYLNLSIWYYVIFGPIVFIFIANKLLRFTLQLFFQKFDIHKHKALVNDFWESNSQPSVDIFLPYAGEDLEIHKAVVQAVSELNYQNYKVYMLDDAGSEEHKALAEKYGFNYLSRPNKGVYKKSGNLEYGYSKSSGEFIFILDADFIPTKDSLHDLIPLIVQDKKIGILQTPQYFEQTKEVHDRSKIEFGGGNIVEDFYRIIMPCRDEFKAAMCVGTSAVYRREAIEQLDGTPKVHASEDLATGLLITQFGYYVKYVPLIASMGKSPETFQGYFKQHMRWCSGNLVFAKYWPIARLNLMARLVYIVNPMYYLSEALTVIFAFQFLVLLYFHADTLSIENTLFFVPYIILSRIIIPLTRTNRNKLGTKLAALNNSYTYFYTYIRMLTQGVPSWHPTGVKVTGIHKDFEHAYNLGTVVSSTFIVCFLFVLLSRPGIFTNYNTYIVLAWTFYSVFWHMLYLSSVAEYVHPFRLKFARSVPDFAFAYARKHLTFFLYCLLISSSLFNVVISQYGEQPTHDKAIEVARTKQNNESKLLTRNVTQSGDVLATTTHVDEEETYSFTVSSGDSLIKLARQAILQYSTENDVTLTGNQTNYASYSTAAYFNEKSSLKPGETVTFDKKVIEGSIELAKEKWKTVATL